MGRRKRLHTHHAQLRITNSAGPQANVRSRARDQLEAHGRTGAPGQTWYRIENLMQTPGTACIYLYGEVGMWGIEAADFIRDLNQVNATAIELHINSIGGEVFEGIAILNALRAHRATITTYVDGLAASIASVIAMAGERVIMGRNTTMMVHEASCIAIGDAAALQAMATMLDQQSSNIAAIYAEKAGGTVDAWRDVMRAETWYLAEEAVAAGLADEVDTAGAPEQGSDVVVEEMAATFDLSIFRYAGRDKAPAPANVAPKNTAAGPDGEPLNVDPAAPENGEEQAPVAEVVEPPVEPPATPAPPVAAEPPEEPDAEPAEDTPDAPLAEQADVADPWAAISSLLNPAPSTVDELLHALLQEGTPA